ncbi:Cytoplasmic axial filament protein CafA and Ribonuclease G [Acidisarcina polymorpha]|uniref:Cytoplasmic axial filament protein CafA and Ribonuclease G n=1 Tax=Acidisarcina polymorpha TaxID=2211140 RepID=A0A2Z5G3S5_9BACT|nr:Rne/Rng family ribonuclease [Acidisarcina polymorpha]AXC13176.1 Cytoplasmic axial filament protein CafA and Ribonuclease G [Acidisarcina polymorpha]
MAKEICISSTPHETRLAILEDDQLTEIYYERENEYTLAGSIYKGRVTRVLPGMQSAFVELGLERDAFLYVTDFMEEQEDSADFEKVPANGDVVRDPQPARESQQPVREPQAREPRPARSPIALETAPRVSADLHAKPQHLPGETGGGEDELQGTRRWRGRRGRRRGGRSQVPREGASPLPVERQPLASGAVEPVVSGYEDEVEAGPVVYEQTIAPGTGQAAFSENFTAREHSPRSAAAAEPIVLPGESLSRYGGKPAEITPKVEGRSAPTPAVANASFKPSTLVEVVPGWDGGAELPGESLSRYRGKATQTAVPPASEIVEHAWGTHSHEPAPAVEEQLPDQFGAPTQEPTTIQDPPAIQEPSAIGDYPAVIDPEQQVEHSLISTGESQEFPAPVEDGTPAQAPVVADHEVVDAAPLSAQEVGPGEEGDLEPENASASYRIDPVAPSEYRVSPFLDEEITAETQSEEPSHFVPEELASPVAVPEDLPAAVVENEAAIAENEAAIGETSTGSSAEEHHAQPIETGNVSISEDLAAGLPEEITALTYEDAVAPHASQEELTSEADHRLEAAHPSLEPANVSAGQAVLDELHEVSEIDFFEEDEFGDGPQGFAPGSGPLEEEIIDEDEYDSEPIRAYAEESDLDDLEEETLDNLAGAELSEMVRDAHLEKRIGASPDGLVEDEEAEYGEADREVEEEDEDEAGEPSQAVAAPLPARRDGRPDDARRGGRGPRRRGRPNGGGAGGGSRRANSQLSDLPIISELLKQGQEILVQIAKEPIAKKGARITSHIALPGRFLVFMPTVNHVGVSRKISSDEERQRLKRILISEKGANSGGFIVRTAADGASEEDLRADIRFLISLWNDIKQRADDAKAPALIYHDLNLIERVLRDQVSANFATIWVDNEAEYERIVRFLNRFEPSLVRRVKLYTKETPLFEQFGIQDEISKALKSKVWLKSGGSIVINQTEALVAIDINTGKYVGKTARLEDTILKTNLDAIPEIVRQIRLRDLGGIIVIDFIDMDERKNRHKVMAALEEELKLDRAPSKVLQFNDFGLVAITRKRVKQSLERTLSVQCEICAGTGMVKSPTTVCNEIYTELRKMQKHLERGDVLLRVHPEVVKTLKANNAKWLNELEELTGKTIIVKSDPALHPEQFDVQ